MCAERGIKYSIIPSSTWKKTCKITGGKRDEQKKSAQTFVLQHYKTKATQDEADAICIGHHVLSTGSDSPGFDWS